MRTGSAEIASALRQRIIDGELPARERLPSERHLADSFGVARGTIRAALGQLEIEGLVETKSGSGTYVVPQTTQDESAMEVVANARPLELMDARFALEPHICRLAVLNARGSDVDRMKELLATMEASVHDPVVFAEADKEFHKQLAELSGNSLLIWIMSNVSNVRNHDEWAAMRRATLNEETIRSYNAQHRAIVSAIASRDPEKAAQLMKRHLESARLSLTRSADA